jgi:hypothetical protein
MMKYRKPTITFGFTFLILTLLYFASCKKDNSETGNYQAQVSAAHNLILQKHNVIQMTIAYFKALKNESLQTFSYAIIDSTDVRLTINQNTQLYTFLHTIKLNPIYNRYMGGTVLVQTDSLPLQPGVQATFSFESFRYYSKKEFPPNMFSAQNIQLVLTDVINNHYIFDQYLENIVFTDTSGLRNIRLDGNIRYDWEKWPGSEYFYDENEKIIISAELSFTNDNGDKVQLSTTEDYIFTPMCGILKGGHGTFTFLNLEPDNGALYYDNHETCNIRGKMEIADLPFYLTIDQWLMK